MKLALHDLPTFLSLRRGGQTGDWAERGIVAWVPSAMARENAGLREATDGGGATVHTCDLEERDVEFYETFRCGLAQRLAESEMLLLFHAERFGSVVLTRDGVIKEHAEALGLQCWSGEPAALNSLFPMPVTHTTVQNFPTRRQVPDRDEPVETRKRPTRGLNGCRSSSETMH
jgi:hypothetical protein